VKVNVRLQLACVWAGPLFAVTYLIAFWAIAGFIPPPSPHWSAAHVGSFFAANHTSIRIGMVLGMVSATLLFPFFTIVSVQIARIEGAGGRGLVLAIMQFGAAVLLLVFFALCGMLWIVASFRSELSASTVRAFNDAGWLMFVMVFPGYTLQMICQAIAGFTDRSPNPTWPRWAAYMNLWVAFSGMGGGIAVFFKHGPFAWNGLIGFYLPLSVFFIWMVVTTYLLRASIRRQAAEADAASGEAAPAPLAAQPGLVGAGA
jgi:hypothetical protein